ncbi:MAG: hypothetical protein Q8R07_04620 [Candidatus Uhrbacteria bacterium]|nr:hypothetical protein [Candidatus Uhrbacteria bacterium]
MSVFCVMWAVGCARDAPLPNPIERAQSLQCVMRWTTLGTQWFEEEMAKYQGRSSRVLIAFYRADKDDVGSNVDSPLDGFTVIKEEDLGVKNPFGYPEYNTTFAVDLSRATTDPPVKDFFGDDGRQRLKPEESIWFHMVAGAPGSPVSTNTAVSVQGWEEDTGECWLAHP